MSFIEDTWMIIPAHNRKKITQDCLNHLQETQRFGEINIVVIDDGSTDGTNEMIRSKFPSVHLIQGDGTWWWTGSIRRGMEYAFERNGEVFLWMNDDIRPEPDAIEVISKAVSQNQNRILCAMVQRDPPYNLEHPRGLRRKLTCRGLKRLKNDESVTYQDGDVVAGKFTAIHKSIVEDIGYPDDDKFPHHDGDFEYTLRATENGFRPAVYTPVIVTDVGEQGELSHSTRLSSDKSLEAVFLDIAQPSRNSGQSYVHLYRKSIRFTPLWVLGILLFVYRFGRASMAVIYKLLLCVVRPEQSFRE